MELHNLTAGYHGRAVLQELTLTLPEGKLIGVLGANGCGKTTLLKCMAGLLPYRGEVLYFGAERATYPRREFAKTVAFLPQTRPIPSLTVREFTAHGRYPHLAFGRTLSAADHTAIDCALAQMRLQELADRPLAELSGGQRQRAYLAMALAQDTRVLLLDEPGTSCDIAQQLDLMELLQALCRQGKTVVAVLHDLPLAFSYCEELVVLNGGKVTAHGSPQQVLQGSAIEDAFGVRCRTFFLDGKTEYFFQKAETGKPE